MYIVIYGSVTDLTCFNQAMIIYYFDIALVQGAVVIDQIKNSE